MRLVVNGPPSCASTALLANQLSSNYYLSLVTPNVAVKNALYVAPPPEVQEGKEEKTEGGEEEEAPVVEPTEEEIAATELREEIAATGTALDENGKVNDITKIPDTLMCRIIQTALSKRNCQNQGWVLQGYPQTWREATGLWAEGTLEDGDADEMDPEGPMPEPDESGQSKPTGVVLLNGTDEWLMEC